MKNTTKVERILEWRESFVSLPADYFFDLIHMYLGEIKTPYNKPKLIETLSVLLRKKENKEVLISYLNEKDIKVLTAIQFLPEVDIVQLEKLFVPAMSKGDLYEQISSLEERLIIYSHENKNTGKKIIAINPLLEDELEEVLSLGNLIAEEKIEKNEIIKETKNTILSPQIIAVFISYILSHPEFCKSNGELKKKTDADLKEICGIESSEIFHRLFISMRNLILIKETEDEKGYEPEWKRLESFCNLPFKTQVVYLCVAGAGVFSRRSLISNASVFSSTIEFSKGKYFTKEKLFAIAFLIKENNTDDDFTIGRFSKIISGVDSNEISATIESMIDSAIDFGFMAVKGQTEKGNKLIYTANENFIENNLTEKKLISVDTSWAVTVLPGLSTKDYLSLVQFLDIVRCDVTNVFEINKQSVFRSFNLGFSKEKIEEVLLKYSSFTIPQNLKISFEEWEIAYNSASLYKGYVLKLSEENCCKAENNPIFKMHIYKILAPGVYLLDFINDEQAQEIMSKVGIDINGKIKSFRKEEFVQELPIVNECKLSFNETNKAFICDKSLCEKNLENFKNTLDKIETTNDQKDGLLDRISRRIILEEEQLRPESVRFELTEAFGMNFIGKIHVLENALQKKSLVEIELTGKEEKILGIVVGIIKNIEIPVVTISVENISTQETDDIEIEIAKISRVRKIRNALSLKK